MRIPDSSIHMDLSKYIFPSIMSLMLNLDPAMAQSFSSHEIIQGLARPGGITPSANGILGARSGALAPLTLQGSEGAIVSDADRSSLSNLLSAYAPPSIDIEILFEFDSANIAAEAHDRLSAVARALMSPELSSASILIAGHTDRVGGAEYNLDLSFRRAAAVRAHLVTVHGVDRNRLFVTGFGFERLKDFLDPESPVNRRVEFINATELFE